MPNEEHLRGFYTSSYFSSGPDQGVGYKDYIADKDAHLANAKNVMKKLHHFWADGPGSLLEIGCAHGFLLHYARSLGWKVKGVDLSRDAVRFAREKLHLDVIEGTISSLKSPAGSFDACLLIGVLDHLPDPLSTLQEVSRVLRSGGLVLLSVGDISGVLPFRWKPPEHLFYFSRRALRVMLEQFNFEVKGIAVFWVWYSMREFLSRLGSYVKVLPAPSWIRGLRGRIKVPTNEVFVIGVKR